MYYPNVLLFIYFSKAFDPIHRQKMGEILLVIPDLWHKRLIGNNEFFEINSGVPQGDTLAPYLCIFTFAPYL